MGSAMGGWPRCCRWTQRRTRRTPWRGGRWRVEVAAREEDSATVNVLEAVLPLATARKGFALGVGTDADNSDVSAKNKRRVWTPRQHHPHRAVPLHSL